MKICTSPGGYVDITYSNYCDESGTGCIDTDPLFVDESNGDYRLTYYSPCINTGNPSDSDPDGTRADMGAIYHPHINISSSTITSDQTWESHNTYRITSPAGCTVNSGVTLTIEEGTRIIVADAVYLTINGTLSAIGTEDLPILFTAGNGGAAEDWMGIKFGNSSVDANCILEYCEIENAKYSVYCYQSGPKIESCKIRDSRYGVYGYYSSAYLDNNRIYDQSSYGGYFIRGNPQFFNNSIYDNSSRGLYFYNYSGAELGPTSGTGKGLNEIYNNPYGIYAYYHSSVFMGSSDSYNNRTGGYNSVPGSSTYDVYANNDCVVNADFNYWGADNAHTQSILNNSEFTHSNHISDPNAGSSLSLSKSSSTFGSEPNLTYEGYNGRKPNINKVSDLCLWAHELGLKNKIDDEIDIYKLLIKKFPESVEARKSLVALYHLSVQHNLKSFTGYLNSMINAEKTPDELQRIACDLLIVGIYINEGEINSAIKECEKIIEKYPDSRSEKSALFHMVHLYQTDLLDTITAKIYLGQLKKKYPNDELTFLAREALGEEVNWALFKPAIDPEPEEEIILPEKYALRDNYPNPFAVGIPMG